MGAGHLLGCLMLLAAIVGISGSVEQSWDRSDLNPQSPNYGQPPNLGGGQNLRAIEIPPPPPPPPVGGGGGGVYSAQPMEAAPVAPVTAPAGEQIQDLGLITRQQWEALVISAGGIGDDGWFARPIPVSYVAARMSAINRVGFEWDEYAGVLLFVRDNEIVALEYWFK